MTPIESSVAKLPPVIYWPGLPLAVLILSAYLWSWWALLSVDMSRLSPPVIFGAIALRTFLHTGLFITAHDAIHGSLCPRWPKLNDVIGAIAMLLYALFWYDFMREKHLQHHRDPATGRDPDYPQHGSQNAILWYCEFIWSYLQGAQRWLVLGGMAILFHTLRIAGQIPIENLLLFWVIPNLLSSAQLFYFGIYLPHREPIGGHVLPHRSTTINLPPILSLFACYHFGYHWQHHEYPHTPWHQLHRCWLATRLQQP